MEDELIFWDHLKLTPDIGFQGIGIMDGYTHFGSMVVISEKATQEFIDTIYDSLDAEGLEGKFGLSMLTVPGFALRVLANTTQETEKIFKTCHRLIREIWFNKKSVFLRKY
jgi:urease accessory protein